MIGQKSFDEAVQIVRAAAIGLLADLDCAELCTDGWANEALGDALVTDALNRSLAQLATTGLWGRDNQMLSNEYWRLAGSRLECGSMQLRARMKPRGYAGDFETLVLCDQHFECNDPLGRLFDRYFQRQAAVEAVRARTQEITAAIVALVLKFNASEFRIASICCGPAIELDRALELLPERCRRRLGIQLFDLDEAALEHSGTRIARWLSAGQWTSHRENLYRLGQRQTDIVKRADLIYCTGLFDYLDDEAAIGLLRFLWGKLCPGGLLTVGNFGPLNPTRAYMEWIGNWYLRYRTPAQLATLAGAAGVSSDSFQIGHDRTGVDLFLTAEKDSN